MSASGHAEGGKKYKKYDWDDKKDICYKLYVEGKKTPRDIVKYFANHFSVPESELPSARLFRRQFHDVWQFPPRRRTLSADDEAVIVERIRQLWEQNESAVRIGQILDEEGYELGDNEFTKLRRRHGFIRRGISGSYDVTTKPSKRWKRKADEVEDQAQMDTDAVNAATSAEFLMAMQQQPPPGLTPDQLAQRQAHLAQRLTDLHRESEAKLATRKRRRRIRGFGFLPADEAGMAPRYDSETTIDECKAFLHLSNEMYVTIRDDYEAICQDMGIERKKTTMESGLWQASKDRLVRENVHLSAIMHPLQPNLDRKAVAIDVICSDVTKRMRDNKKKMSIADANNALGLNPLASKKLRKAFYDILEHDHYTTRMACGEEHWNELQQAWHNSSPVLQSVITEGDPYKLRCVYMLCRDATKRYNDDGVRRDPSRKQYQQGTGPGPGALRVGGKGKKAAATATEKPRKNKATVKNGLSGPSFGMAVDPALTNPYLPEPQPIPAYFRLSPQSSLIGNHPRMWLGKLATRTLASLHEAAASKAGAATVTRVQGVIKNEDGTEDSYQIDGDDELDVYLEAAGDKSTFLVLLEGGYA
ncbi:hypothetical protein BAUCODRAFT_21966 [Baudoinia panamericana UAMH 10762]|uniref:Uncharacterized protein n=1 Tax=Baudoinia panamericana (strain UAMH 10762) TaxID=717646 RepID=M2N3N0_BAUPA|nr:uncharacterized protein BAUCODRAFT_21966 [Baudoinia panamericana UAMH 10762]EMC98573.1 hypothetical protein BAUCODRAFT_21966 [Baudoinia panamericana UAMH 10762]